MSWNRVIGRYEWPDDGGVRGQRFVGQGTFEVVSLG
jgi:hypothetical protein